VICNSAFRRKPIKPDAIVLGLSNGIGGRLRGCPQPFTGYAVGNILSSLRGL